MDDKQRRTPVRIEWYAGTDEITRMGPFRTQIEAWEALRLTPEASRRYGTRIHPPGAYVWPEFAPDRMPTPLVEERLDIGPVNLQPDNARSPR